MVHLARKVEAMTLEVSTKEGFLRALEIIMDDIARGAVVSFSSHYDAAGPVKLARLSILYALGEDGDPELPNLPGVSVETASDDDADTEPR